MAFDAGDTMSRIMPNGTPDRERLAGLADVLERAHVAAARPQSRTVVVGEMVDLLCRSGRTDAAISLEKLWNDLTPRHPFLTMCMYSLDCFTGQADSDRLQRVCAEHSAVVHG
jgi:hypothetical protein